MGGANTQQPQMSQMMTKETMQEFTNPDGSKTIYGGDMPYYGDAKPMVVPSNNKEPLRNVEYLQPTQMKPMLKEEKVTILDPSGKEEASYAQLEKQGMSGDFDQEVIGAVKDLGKIAKKKLIDPAISAGKDAASMIFSGTNNVRYDRDAAASEFKGVKAQSKPAKSDINVTADEAMRDL
jgi:hypothetical protein